MSMSNASPAPALPVLSQEMRSGLQSLDLSAVLGGSARDRNRDEEDITAPAPSKEVKEEVAAAAGSVSAEHKAYQEWFQKMAVHRLQAQEQALPPYQLIRDLSLVAGRLPPTLPI